MTLSPPIRPFFFFCPIRSASTPFVPGVQMMSGISRHDITANDHGKGVEGMLVLTELRLLFVPDISGGSTTASFMDFHTVQASSP